MYPQHQDSKKKRFVFPEDVQSEYNVISGISLKNLVFIVFPFATIGLGIVFLPPYTPFLLMIRIVIGLLVGFIGLGMVLMRPIPERRNITIIQWLTFQQAYSKRQKLFFIQQKSAQDHFRKG